MYIPGDWPIVNEIDEVDGKKVYEVQNLSDEVIGHIKWHGAANSYGFIPVEGIIFESIDLRTVGFICDKATEGLPNWLRN
mgnify:CR=1 FL=1